MELTREQERRLQQLIDKCNKIDDDSLNIYEVMNGYKCYQNASDGVKDYVYELVANALSIGNYNPTVYGYARCSTNEDKQDINRQIRELKDLGATDKTIYLEYASGTKVDRIEFNKLLDTVNPGDTIVTTEVSRLSRSTQHLCEIINIIKNKQLKLIIGTTMTIDCTKGELDPMTNAFLQMSGVFAELERNIISQRVKSGLENARAKGRIGGRPKVSADKLPKSFYKYYEQWKNKDIKKVEFARLLNVSRPTLDLYINTYEASK